MNVKGEHSEARQEEGKSRRPHRSHSDALGGKQHEAVVLVGVEGY